MENKQGTSFIPKSPVRGTVKPKGVRKVYIFTYVSFVFFFGTLLATAGTFFYDISINSQLSTQKERLSEERSLFNQADLERVRELEKRMDTAFTILDKKVSLYSLFNTLEDTTLRTAQIIGFEYKKDVDGSLDLALIVSTSDFNASLFQREIFSDNTVLQGASISEITYTDGLISSDGETPARSEVLFTVSKEMEVSEIPYTAAQQVIAPAVIEDVQTDETESVSTDSEGDVILETEEVTGQ